MKYSRKGNSTLAAVLGLGLAGAVVGTATAAQTLRAVDTPSEHAHYNAPVSTSTHRDLREEVYRAGAKAHFRSYLLGEQQATEAQFVKQQSKGNNSKGVKLRLHQDAQEWLAKYLESQDRDPTSPTGPTAQAYFLTILNVLSSGFYATTTKAVKTLGSDSLNITYQKTPSARYTLELGGTTTVIPHILKKLDADASVTSEVKSYLRDLLNHADKPGKHTDGLRRSFTFVAPSAAYQRGKWTVSLPTGEHHSTIEGLVKDADRIIVRLKDRRPAEMKNIMDYSTRGGSWVVRALAREIDLEDDTDLQKLVRQRRGQFTEIAKYLSQIPEKHRASYERALDLAGIIYSKTPVATPIPVPPAATPAPPVTRRPIPAGTLPPVRPLDQGSESGFARRAKEKAGLGKEKAPISDPGRLGCYKATNQYIREDLTMLRELPISERRELAEKFRSECLADLMKVGDQSQRDEDAAEREGQGSASRTPLTSASDADLEALADLQSGRSTRAAQRAAAIDPNKGNHGLRGMAPMPYFTNNNDKPLIDPSNFEALRFTLEDMLPAGSELYQTMNRKHAITKDEVALIKRKAKRRNAEGVFDDDFTQYVMNWVDDVYIRNQNQLKHMRQDRRLRRPTTLQWVEHIALAFMTYKALFDPETETEYITKYVDVPGDPSNPRGPRDVGSRIKVPRSRLVSPVGRGGSFTSWDPRRR